MSEKNKKGVGGLVALIVALCLLFAGVSVMCVGMYQSLTDKLEPEEPTYDEPIAEELVKNPHNLIRPQDFTFVDGGTGYGFKMTENNGVVIIEGASITRDFSMEIARFRLAPGTYTFTSSDFYDLNNFCMKIRTGDSESMLLAPTNRGNTFTLTEPIEVVVMFYGHAGYVLNDDNRYFYPMLVEDDKPESFYVTDSEAAEMTASKRVEWYNVTITCDSEAYYPTVTYKDINGNDIVTSVSGGSVSFIVYSNYNSINVAGYEDVEGKISGDYFGDFKINGDVTLNYTYEGKIHLDELNS